MEQQRHDNVDRWKKCGVSQLAMHFHRYDTQRSQYTRLSSLALTRDDIDALFPAGHEITSFAIELAVAPQVVEGEYTFRPWISSYQNNNGPGVYREFYAPTTDSFVRVQAAPVPVEFKDMVSGNWLGLDISLVDDIFSSTFLEREEPGNITYGPARVLKYCFSPARNVDFFNFIRRAAGHISEFIFYLGMDMNKLGRHDTFGFSPVIEVITDSLSDSFLRSVYQSGLRCRIHSDTQASVSYEYMSPCPSSC